MGPDLNPTEDLWDVLEKPLAVVTLSHHPKILEEDLTSVWFFGFKDKGRLRPSFSRPRFSFGHRFKFCFSPWFVLPFVSLVLVSFRFSLSQ